MSSMKWEDSVKIQSKYAKSFGLAAFGAALTISSFALANGEEFFQPAGDGKVDLVYFGQIKDTEGHVLDGAIITVAEKHAGMTFPFQNDAVGHYRSPDIGAAIKDLGEEVDPN